MRELRRRNEELEREKEESEKDRQQLRAKLAQAQVGQRSEVRPPLDGVYPRCVARVCTHSV